MENRKKREIPDYGIQRHADEATFEKILHDELVVLKKLVLKYRSVSMIHDQSHVNMYLDETAQEAVDREIRLSVSRMSQMRGGRGSKASHTAAAYMQSLAQLNSELHYVIFTDERKRIESLTQSNKHQQDRALSETTDLATQLARSKQHVDSLVEETSRLTEANAELTEKNEYLARELMKTVRDQQHVHQNIVELRMQGIDFKSEVNRRCLKVLRSIQSRMGFVPSGVQKQVLLLNILKAPGDPAYDDIRTKGYREILAKSSYVIAEELSALVPPETPSCGAATTPYEARKQRAAEEVQASLAASLDTGLGGASISSETPRPVVSEAGSGAETPRVFEDLNTSVNSGDGSASELPEYHSRRRPAVKGLDEASLDKLLRTNATLNGGDRVAEAAAQQDQQDKRLREIIANMHITRSDVLGTDDEEEDDDEEEEEAIFIDYSDEGTPGGRGPDAEAEVETFEDSIASTSSAESEEPDEAWLGRVMSKGHLGAGDDNCAGATGIGMAISRPTSIYSNQPEAAADIRPAPIVISSVDDLLNMSNLSLQSNEAVLGLETGFGHQATANKGKTSGSGRDKGWTGNRQRSTSAAAAAGSGVSTRKPGVPGAKTNITPKMEKKLIKSVGKEIAVAVHSGSAQKSAPPAPAAIRVTVSKRTPKSKSLEKPKRY